MYRKCYLRFRVSVETGRRTRRASGCCLAGSVAARLAARCRVDDPGTRGLPSNVCHHENSRVSSQSDSGAARRAGAARRGRVQRAPKPARSRSVSAAASSSSRRRFTPAAAARAAASSSPSRPARPRQIARDMIGMTLVTHQTGPEGRVVVARAGRRRPADDARAVSEHRARSRRRQAGDDGQRRRRHGHRGSGGEDARADRQASTSSPASASCRSRRGSSASASASTVAQVNKFVKVMTALYEAYRRHRRVAARDQPARRHRRAAICWRSTRR